MTAEDSPRPLHPRVSVSGLCFPDAAAVEGIRRTAALGVTKTSMTSGKLRDAGVEKVRAASAEFGVQVVTTTALVRFDLTPGADVSAQGARAREDVDQAAAVGAGSVYTLTGPRVFDSWSENADAYVRLVGPVADYAASRGVVLALEPTSWLYADLNFAHTFRDTVALASQAGMQVCLDLFHVWTEADLRAAIATHLPLIAHVQISDQEAGRRSLPCRAVPGEGLAPLRAITGWLLDAGYTGVFDIELDGPRIDAAGAAESALAAAQWMDAVLVELNADT